MKQGILFLRRMGYPAQKMMKKTEYKKRIRSWISQRGERLSKTIQQDSGLYLQYVSGKKRGQRKRMQRAD